MGVFVCVTLSLYFVWLFVSICFDWTRLNQDSV